VYKASKLSVSRGKVLPRNHGELTALSRLVTTREGLPQNPTPFTAFLVFKSIA